MPKIKLKLNANPSLEPTRDPTSDPTGPSFEPTTIPSNPSLLPTVTPSQTLAPSEEPTIFLSFAPSLEPSIAPSMEPSTSPSFEPTSEPTAKSTHITMGRIPHSEYLVLLKIYQDTNGANWNYSTRPKPVMRKTVPWNFDSSEENTYPCGSSKKTGSGTWIGLICKCYYFNGPKLEDDYYDYFYRETTAYYSPFSAFRQKVDKYFNDSGICHIEQLLLQNLNLTGSLSNVSIEHLPELNKIDAGYNSLTGSLPSGIFNLTNLNVLDLKNNHLTGSIPQVPLPRYLKTLNLVGNNLHGLLPSNFFNYTSYLEDVDLTGNSFTGPIPHPPNNNSVLKQFAIGLNSFSGPFPSKYVHYATLTVLDISSRSDANGNKFTGDFPVFGYLPNIISIVMDNNAFNTSIPDSLYDLATLKYLSLLGNAITGTLSNRIGNLTNLVIFVLNDNKLVGTIPNALTELNQAIYINLKDNRFTGTIPSNIGNLNLLTSLDLSNNKLNGVIPTSIGKLTLLTYLRFNNNTLTGTIPDSMRNLSYLDSIILSNNNLDGPVSHKFPSNKSLTTIDLSFNAFSGTLPYDLFNGTILRTFIGISNCFSGTISNAICDAKQLNVISLCGASIASKCIRKIFNNAYQSRHPIDGSIPSCLFALPNIELLHLSGNQLAGTIPGDVTYGSKLNDLVLSNNLLTGTIPDQIQFRKWFNLDLGFNKLTGELKNNFTVPVHNATVKLQINRLSGKIPQSIRELGIVSVLDGNLFFCSLISAGVSLPFNDPKKNKYDCGSNSMNLSIYIWLGVSFCSCIIIAILFFPEARGSFSKIYQYFIAHLKVFEPIVKSDDGAEIIGTKSSKVILQVSDFGIIMGDIRRTAVIFTLFIMMVLLPAYGALSVHYRTFSNKYAWELSALYLKGSQGAICLFVLLIVFLIVFYFTTHYLKVKHKTFKIKKLLNQADLVAPQGNKRLYYFIGSLAFLFDIGVIGVLNYYFVRVVLNGSVAQVRVFEVALAIFKLGWNNAVMPKIMEILSSATKIRSSIVIRILIIIVNNIIIPCIATAVVNTNCFYYILTNSPPVTTTFHYSLCANIQIINDITECTSLGTVIQNLSFVPPFQYSYQCASNLVANYATVYVYAFVIGSFAVPLAWETMHLFGSLIPKRDSKFWRTIRRKLPKLVQPLTEEDIIKMRHTEKQVFNSPKFISWTLNALILMVTFGALFPPLAIVICLSIFAKTYYTQLLIARRTFLAEEMNLPEYHEITNRDCKYIENAFRYFYWVISPVCSTFYAFIIFDTFGDQVGYIHALWAPIVISCMPYIILISMRLIVKKCVNNRKNDGNNRSRLNLLGFHSSSVDESRMPSDYNKNSKGQQAYGIALKDDVIDFNDNNDNINNNNNNNDLEMSVIYSSSKQEVVIEPVITSIPADDINEDENDRRSSLSSTISIKDVELSESVRHAVV
eukprot:gene12790-17147_t